MGIETIALLKKMINIDEILQQKSVNNEYETNLNNIEENKFKKWFEDSKQNGKILKEDNGTDYDFRGYFKNEVLNGKDTGSANSHFTDKYKKPNHQTFSNESIYAVGDNLSKAGHWIGDKFIPAKK